VAAPLTTQLCYSPINKQQTHLKCQRYRLNNQQCIRQGRQTGIPRTHSCMECRRTTGYRSVASIQIYFEGAKFFPSQGGGERSPRPEKPRVGMGFLGRGQRAPFPPARGVGKCCKLPQRDPGRNPGKFEIWCNLRPQNSVQKCLITCKLLQKG